MSWDVKWRIGDEALAFEPVGREDKPEWLQPTGRTGQWNRLEPLAEKYGITLSLLLRYRSIAHRWPRQHRREDVPWSVHDILRAFDDRFAVIQTRESWTVREAQAFRERRQRTDGS